MMLKGKHWHNSLIILIIVPQPNFFIVLFDTSNILHSYISNMCSSFQGHHTCYLRLWNRETKSKYWKPRKEGSPVSICFGPYHQFEESDNCFWAFSMFLPSASVFEPKMHLAVCTFSSKQQHRKSPPNLALVESSQPGWHLRTHCFCLSVWSLIVCIIKAAVLAKRCSRWVWKWVLKNKHCWETTQNGRGGLYFFSPFFLLPVSSHPASAGTLVCFM